MASRTSAVPRVAQPKPRPRRRRFSDPGATWAKGLERRRPGLVTFVLEQLAERYGRPVWVRRLDPTSELILTILTQNSADINAERAFESLRAAFPSGRRRPGPRPGPGLGRGGPLARRGAGLGGRRDRAPGRSHRGDPAGRPRRVEVAPDPGRSPPHPRGTRRPLARVPRRHGAARRARLAHPDRRDRQEDRVRAAHVQLRDAPHPGRPARGAGRPAGGPHPTEGLGRRRPRPLPGDGPARAGAREPT